MAGLATGSTRSQMTRTGPAESRRHSIACACTAGATKTGQGPRPANSVSALLVVEFDEQSFGLSQIGRVEALGEPPVDRRQQVVGFAYPPLVAH